MFDTSAKAVKLDTRCSWQGHSKRGGDVGDESAEFQCSLTTSHRLSAQGLLSLSYKLMSCAATTNGCLDL